MAGLGRRTHYRKHLTDSVLFDLPEPGPFDRIAKVVSTRGSNQFDVRLATATTEQDDSGNTVLAILPTKFRKLVWVKRNDFVIVQTVDDAESKKDNDGIRYMITSILYKDQIQNLQSKGFWPSHDSEFDSTHLANDSADTAENGEFADVDSGIVDEEDSVLFVNTNRVAKIVLEDSSSDEE